MSSPRGHHTLRQKKILHTAWHISEHLLTQLIFAGNIFSSFTVLPHELVHLGPLESPSKLKEQLCILETTVDLYDTFMDLFFEK